MTRQQHDFDRAAARLVAPDDLPLTVVRSFDARSMQDERRERLIQALTRESDLRHALLRRKWRGK